MLNDALPNIILRHGRKICFEIELNVFPFNDVTRFLFDNDLTLLQWFYGTIGIETVKDRQI